jgi:hypothetical protein
VDELPQVFPPTECCVELKILRTIFRADEVEMVLPVPLFRKPQRTWRKGSEDTCSKYEAVW